MDARAGSPTEERQDAGGSQLSWTLKGEGGQVQGMKDIRFARVPTSRESWVVSSSSSSSFCLCSNGLV